MVIDYKTQTFEELLQNYDAVFDISNYSNFLVGIFVDITFSNFSPVTFRGKFGLSCDKRPTQFRSQFKVRRIMIQTCRH